MQREIKLRAWDKEKQEMIYQDGNTARDNGVMDVQISFTDMGASIFTRGYGGIAWEEVRDFELMQYTGLKDKNGKEIYEGDILRCTNHNQFYWIIGFENGCFVGRQSNCNDYWIELHRIFKHNELEVIGNIHDNPELLEVSE